MDLMDDELRRVLAGHVDPPEDSMARELARLRARDRGPTATEMAEASQPSFRMSSAGKRQPDQRGGGAALEALGSTILGSVPAGLAGAAVLPFQGPEAAAKTVGRVQEYLTLDPQTEGGDKALLGIVKALAPLGAPAQAIGDLTLRATGSPLAATAAEIVLDPLNAAGLVAAAPALRAGARAAGRGVKRAGQSAAQNLGPKVAELAESYMRRSGMTPEITTYHGTPHTFPAEPGLPLGRFRAEKIGSGEGGQMFGHGIYVAESPDVAKGYAEQLANRDASNQGRLNAHANAKRLAELQGGANYAADDIRFALETNDNHPQKKLLQDTLSFLESGKYKEPLQNKGTLYTVDLPDPIVDRMLDWDRPVKEQSQQVQKIIQQLVSQEVGQEKAAELMLRDSFTGQNAMLHLPAKSSIEDSQVLQRAGIPGIRYLDQGSRGAKEGTRNFVVFPGEEQNLRILERGGVKAENAVKKAQGGPVKGSDMSYSQTVNAIKNGLIQGGMDGRQAMDAALRMAESKMRAGGAVMMAGGGATRRTRYEGPMLNRPVVNGQAMVSAEELADFRRQFGADKTLRDLLNADRGLTRRGETPSAQDMRARGPQGASEAPASPYSDPSRVMEGVAASQREIARPGRDAVEPVAPELAVAMAPKLAMALAPRIAQLLGVSASALRARIGAAGKDWRDMPPRGADRAKWDAIVKQIDDAAGPSAGPSKGPSFVQRPPSGRVDPPFGTPQPGVRGVMERPEVMLAGGGAAKGAARAAARAAERATHPSPWLKSADSCAIAKPAEHHARSDDQSRRQWA